MPLAILERKLTLRFRNRCEEILNLKEVFGEFSHAVFVERENRFVGRVLLGGKLFTCHISDTGRLRELLTNGAEVLLSKNREKLKTDYRLIAVKKGKEWVLINTSVHSRIAHEIMKRGYLGFLPESVQREVKAGSSRLDFLIDGNFFIEVKGVNLSKNGICFFPDAPTKRGRKHLIELKNLKNRGFRAGILLLSFRNCSCFLPNSETDEEFARTFWDALESGVEFFGFRLKFAPESGKICLAGRLKVRS